MRLLKKYFCFSIMIAMVVILTMCGGTDDPIIDPDDK